MRVDLDIVPDTRLGEGASFTEVVDLLATAAPGAVLCTHGDVIPETIAALQRRGCEVTTAPDWRKGTVWSIDRVDGEFTRARVWSPPH